MSEPTALKDWNTIQDYLKSAWADDTYMDSPESRYLIKFKAPTPICKFGKTLRENQGVVPEPEVQPLKTAIPSVIPPIYDTIKSPLVKLDTSIEVPFFAFINLGWKGMLHCNQAVTPYGSASESILDLARCLFLTLEKHFIKTENTGKNVEELVGSERENLEQNSVDNTFYKFFKSQERFKVYSRRFEHEPPGIDPVSPGTLSRFISKIYYEYLLALSDERLATALADQGPKAIFDHRVFETDQIEYQGPELPEVLTHVTYPMLTAAFELLTFSPALLESMEHKSSAEKIRYPFGYGFTETGYFSTIISSIVGVSGEPNYVNAIVNTDFIYQSDSSVAIRASYDPEKNGPSNNLIPVLLSKLVSHTEEDVETEYAVNCKKVKRHKLNEVLNRRLFPINFKEFVLKPNYELMSQTYGHQTSYKNMMSGISSGNYYSHLAGGWRLASERPSHIDPWEVRDMDQFPDLTPTEPKALSLGAGVPGIQNHQDVFNSLGRWTARENEQLTEDDFPKREGSMDHARINSYNRRYMHKYVSPTIDFNSKPSHHYVFNTLPIGRVFRVYRLEDRGLDQTPLSFRIKSSIRHGVNKLDERMLSNSLESKSVLVSDEFVKKNNTLAVQDNGQWYYFRVSPERKDSIRPGINNPKFIKLFKRPEIFRDGYITIRNKTYAVSRKDLFRGLVQCSKRLGAVTDQHPVSPADREHIDQESNLVQQQQESEIQNSQDS